MLGQVIFLTEGKLKARAGDKVQAVTLGPYVMAALTDKDRSISLDPANIADHVHDVNPKGFISVRASDGRVLKQTGLSIALAEESSCLSKMECTFRCTAER